MQEDTKDQINTLDIIIEVINDLEVHDLLKLKIMIDKLLEDNGIYSI